MTASQSARHSAPAGPGTTTTTTTSPTTSTVPSGASCGGLTGLRLARCTLEHALASAPCADPVPAALAHRLQRKLAAADQLLGRATGARGAKQARFVKKARGKLGAVSREAMAAVAAKNAKKRITAGCGATIGELVAAVESDLPQHAVVTSIVRVD